jgi:hypothetical protein
VPHSIFATRLFLESSLNNFVQGGDIGVPGFVGVPFENTLNIVVQGVEVEAIWGPKYFHVVAATILHQMAIMFGFSVLLEFTRLANSYFFDPRHQFLLKNVKVIFFSDRFTLFKEIRGHDIMFI